jgi:hypothetical protein
LYVIGRFGKESRNYERGSNILDSDDSFRDRDDCGDTEFSTYGTSIVFLEEK